MPRKHWKMQLNIGRCNENVEDGMKTKTMKTLEDATKTLEDVMKTLEDRMRTLKDGIKNH
jgi:hypothetical protein